MPLCNHGKSSLQGIHMGQVNHPVFDAPACHALDDRTGRPVDLVHLARQTGGDKMLEEEVLHLFLRQANMLARDLSDAKDSDGRRRLAHTLCGTARAVGAFRVAEMARDIEENPAQAAHIKPLVAQVDVACDYISSLLR
jgi:HPt (histidine-containing phosphotransfer) domain-containing protein